MSAGAQFAAKDQGPSPVATGGTQYASPDKVAPLFVIPTRSVVGDGTMVGDKGFYPLGVADSVEKLRIYRGAQKRTGARQKLCKKKFDFKIPVKTWPVCTAALLLLGARLRQS